MISESSLSLPIEIASPIAFFPFIVPFLVGFHDFILLILHIPLPLLIYLSKIHPPIFRKNEIIKHLKLIAIIFFPPFGMIYLQRKLLRSNLFIVTPLFVTLIRFKTLALIYFSPLPSNQTINVLKPTT